MRRGTRVGEAYVAVTADGDGINEQITKSVDDAGPGVEKAGDEHGRQYGDRFSDRFRERMDGMRDKVASRLSTQMGEAGNDGGKQYGDNFEKSFKKLAKRIGKSVGKELSNNLEMSFASMLDDLETRLATVSRNLSNAGGPGSQGGTAKNLGPPPIAQRRLEAAYREDRAFDRMRVRLLEGAARENEARERALGLMHERAIRMNEDRDRSLGLMHERAIRMDMERTQRIGRMQEAALRMNVQFNEGRRGGDGNLIPGGNGKNDKGGLGATVGKLFGAGSRNNFFNIFGKALGGIVGSIDNIVRSGGKMFSLFGKGFSAAAEDASFLQKSMAGLSEVGSGIGGGLSKAFSAIISSGPAALVAVATITAALSVMVSVVGALIGLVTALAATIAAALTGALLVAGGAMAALAAAGGLLVVAFTSMTDAQKKMLSDAFRPLKEELVGIGQIMLQDMVPAFHTWSANLQAALMQAVPVAQVMGKAFANAGTILTASFSGPGFQMFSQQLAVYLPGIVTKLSFALGQFLNGTLGLFSALLPYVNRFAGYLGMVATKFANWATSAQGQNAISDFVGRAVVSLQSLWGAVSAFSQFVAKVLFSPEAMNAGNSIFDSIAKTFRSFIQKVSEAQANGSFKRWFDDAIKFGSALWSVIKALGAVFMALYSSGVLTAVTAGLKLFAFQIRAILFVASPMLLLFKEIGKGINWLADQFTSGANQINKSSNGIWNSANTIWQASGLITNAMAASAAHVAGGSANALENAASNPGKAPSSSISMPDLQASGLAALNATSVKNGGYKPNPVKQPKQYHNPYTKWANSLIKEGPTVAAQIKNAMLSMNKSIAKGIRAAVTDTGGESSVRDAIATMMTNVTTGGAQVVNTARDALNSAASSLASASSKGAAMAALRKVRAAQKSLRAALQDQKTLNEFSKYLASQKTVHWTKVDQMVKGLAFSNATLADLAAARSRVAAKLDAANQKLTDAINLRDQYKQQITDSIKSFGDLSTAQAQTVDGVEQALTSGDITSNLQARLDKIRKFQNDLKLLIAQGLSNDAYKQIVDQGVESGTTLADALLAGGSSAIQQTNSLVGQINTIATQLGTETSSRLYQAGVDAAKGLVDGLTSLSAQLDSAALKLGNSIASAVKKALGIKSPSRVLRDMMNYVGDGAVLGLQDQHIKVGSAAAAMAGLIAVNPAGGSGSRSTTTSEDAVSGNGQKFRDLIVHTPTDDPQAVAHEVLNEVVGRL